MSLEIKHACPKCQSTKTQSNGQVGAVCYRVCMGCGHKDKSIRYSSFQVKAIILDNDVVIHNHS